MGERNFKMKEIEFTEREIEIMREAFITGRIYGILGKQKSDAEIDKGLRENCIRAIEYSKLSEAEKIWW